MNKLIFTFLFTVVFSVISFASSVGIIDIKEVFSNYKEAQKMQTEYETKEKAFKEKLEKRQAELRKIEDERKYKEIEKKYQEELEKDKDTLLDLNAKMSEKIKNNILAAVTRVARQKALSTVVDKQAVLYGGFDITKDVLSELNK